MDGVKKTVFFYSVGKIDDEIIRFDKVINGVNVCYQSIIPRGTSHKKSEQKAISYFMALENDHRTMPYLLAISRS